jgi:glycosyltransferase involved in cell wall biosynthesis
MAKLLYFVAEDYYFLSHRLPVARKAKELGFDVCVVSKINSKENKKRIEDEGFRAIPINLIRTGTNPITELKSLIELIKIYRKEKPDMVHHVAIKPVIYGSIAAIFNRTPAVINAVAGLGMMFSNKDIKSRIIRFFITIAFRLLLNRKNSRLILQNADDQNFFVNSKIIKRERTIKIKGSGVDVEKYTVEPEPKTDKIIVSLVSRMLWNKGIGEIVEAARLLKKTNPNVVIRLIGAPDLLNSKTVSQEQLESWHKEGVIEYLGRRSDIVNVWHESHIATLPSSYGEGLPKCLLEAGACEKPMVTTDIPGCRELVQNNVNGLIIPPRNAEELAKAIAKLAEDEDLRKKLGKTARQMIIDDFSSKVVAKETGELYSSLYEENKR